MNTIRLIACALVALVSLPVTVPAQLQPGLTASVQRLGQVDTGWIDSPLASAYPDDVATALAAQPITLGTVNLARPARFVGVVEIRYVCLVENPYAAVVDEYQVYSRNDFRIGGTGFQLCSDLCGALENQDALAPTDGTWFVVPSPLPEHNVGVGDPTSDHHLMPVNIAIPFAIDLPAGVSPITLATAGAMKTWNDVPVMHESHAWRLGWERYQARIRGQVVR